MSTTPTPVTRAPKKKANGVEKHSLTVRFTTEEDVVLYEHLLAEAKRDRRPLDVYVLIGLHDHFQIPEGTTPNAA